MAVETLTRQAPTLRNEDTFRYRNQSTTLYSISGNITVGYIVGTSFEWNFYVRFYDIDIPQGRKINRAYLSLEAVTTRGTQQVQVRFRSDEGTVLTNITNWALADARAKGTQFIDWSNVPPVVTGNRYKTPNLARVIQEIVDDVGWTSGDALGIFALDNGTDEGPSNNILREFEGDAGSAEPSLFIDFGSDPEEQWSVGSSMGIS